MSQFVIYALIFICVVVCVIAINYIRKHHSTIKQAKFDALEQEKNSKQRYEERRAYLIESIQVIAKAVGNDEKLTYTEACMRLTALLESLEPNLLQHADYSVIFEVYKRTEHSPIKGEWKKLSKQKQWKYKQEMASVESEFGDEVCIAARKLAAFDFNAMMH